MDFAGEADDVAGKPFVDGDAGEPSVDVAVGVGADTAVVAVDTAVDTAVGTDVDTDVGTDDAVEQEED